MKDNSKLDKELELYNRELIKDNIEIEVDKRKFIDAVLNQGLGNEMVDFKTYQKKPSRKKIFWNKLKRILWNV